MSGDDALLFLDRNGNGTVDDAGDLFGNWTYLSSVLLADHGYQALRELDTNNDGWITAADLALLIYASGKTLGAMELA